MRIRPLTVFLLLAPLAAVADEAVPTPSSPARLVPADLTMIVAVDFPQIRAAGPADTIKLVMDGARAALGRVGAEPEKLGAVAFAVQVPKPGEARPPSVVIADVPVDVKKLEKTANGKVTTTRYDGVTVRTDKRDSYALLPHDRIVLVEGMKIQRVIDLARGKGVPLVDQAASALLVRVGATGGRGPALFGWIKLDTMKAQLAQQAPGLASVDESALALTLATSGADLKLVGRAANKEGAAAAAKEVRDALARLAKDPTVAMLGLRSLVEAARVQTGDEWVTVALHLTREQYVDLVTRLTGAVSQALQSMTEQLPAPAPVEPVRPRPAKAN